MARRHSRRRPHTPSTPLLVGVAWYDPVEWSKLKQVASDAENLDDTYEAWQRNLERTERELSAKGLVVRRVLIDVDALVEWCRAHNRVVNGAARAEYTSQIVRGGI